MADFRVLFVCVGNVCRSPLGELLLQGQLSDGFEVASAGVKALAGHGMSEGAALELEVRGGDASTFRARQLTDEMLVESDLVLTATRELRSRILAEAPLALHRTFTVLEFAALVEEVDAVDPRELVARAAEARSGIRLDDYDIPDPWQRGPQAHALAAGLMAEAVQRIAKGFTR